MTDLIIHISLCVGLIVNLLSLSYINRTFGIHSEIHKLLIRYVDELECQLRSNNGTGIPIMAEDTEVGE